MNSTSYASITALALVTVATLTALLFLIPMFLYASAYVQAQPSEIKPVSECGRAGCMYELSFEGGTYSILYDIASYGTPAGVRTADIDKIAVNTEKRSLMVSFNATSYGKLYLSIPRSLLESSQDGKDVAFTVFINGEKSDEDVTEVTGYMTIGSGSATTGQDTRVLSIAYNQNTRQIEIIGTQIAPEFGSVAASAVVMAAAILAVVGITSIIARRQFSA